MTRRFFQPVVRAGERWVEFECLAVRANCLVQAARARVRDGHVLQHAQIVRRFYPLGHQFTAKDRGDLLQCLDGFELVAMGAQVFGEVFVDLNGGKIRDYA